MSLIITWIYIGGACGNENTKVGFWNRLFWPLVLGEKIAAYLWRNKQ